MHSSFSEYNTKMNIQRRINEIAADQATRDKVFDEVGTTKEILTISQEELPNTMVEFLKQDGSSATDPRTVLGWLITGFTYPRKHIQHFELEVSSLSRKDKNNRRLHILADFVRYWFPKGLNIALYDYYGGNPSTLLDEMGIIRQVESGLALPIEGYTEKKVTIVIEVLMKRD